jgi:exopolyphosphatase/guanosine-5'-triphosphate,3'-diphosphate pyrophosphatase
MERAFISESLREAAELFERYEKEPEHPRHVAILAGQLFDSLGNALGRGDEEKHILHLAALLHDIGWFYSPTGDGHHKESAKMIARHPWKSLTPGQVALVAQVARYHRKALPDDEKHEPYRALEEASRNRVRELAGILRVADALDRTHRQIVRQVEARTLPDAILLRVEAAGAWSAEREQVLKKCDLLEIATGRKIKFAPG